MSESLALDPSPLPGERTTKPAAKFGAMFKAVLESMVAAQTRQIDATGPLMYRYPPI
jgi:hypothetical protein